MRAHTHTNSRLSEDFSLIDYRTLNVFEVYFGLRKFCARSDVGQKSLNLISAEVKNTKIPFSTVEDNKFNKQSLFM